MKKLTFLLILISLAVLAGCSNPMSREEDMKNQDSFTGDFYVEEHSGDPQEREQEIGESAEGMDASLPENLYGTWTVTQGLPPELTSYSLTISSDGAVEQKTTDTAGTSQSISGRCVSDGEKYAIVNDEGITLLTFEYKDNQLTSDSLSSEPVVFTKTQA